MNPENSPIAEVNKKSAMIEVPDWESNAPEQIVEHDPFAVGESVIVKRSDDKIDLTGWVVSGSEIVDGVDYRIVKKLRDDGVELTKRLALSELEATRESMKEKLSRDLGYEAINGVGVEEPSDDKSEKSNMGLESFDALPKNVQDEVDSYKRAVANKLQSETDKDFVQAKYDSQRLYEISRDLSPEAKTYLGF